MNHNDLQTVLCTVGTVSHPSINHGKPLPVYDNFPRQSKELDINTPEGWNKKCQEINTHATADQLAEAWKLWHHLLLGTE